MSTLADPDVNVNLLRAKSRLEREVLRPAGEPEKWTLRCMHIGCDWAPKQEFQTLEAARTVGEFHNDSTGHPVEPAGWIKVKGAIIRAKAAR